eukprot:m.189906 g.189906  ORF g.189906 m.189906 type:complete len:366 (+) comp17887_c0_seq1:180-1277(+)
MGWNFLREPCGHSAATRTGHAATPTTPGLEAPPHAMHVLPEPAPGTLAAAVSASVVSCLERDGYVVIDGALDSATASGLRTELLELQTAGLLRPNQTAFGHPPRRFTKPHVYEYDLHAAVGPRPDPVAAGMLGRYTRLFHHACTELVDRLNYLCPGLSLVRGPRGIVVKLQYNDGGGGCFPLHYDNPGPPNRRILTCLVYLNPQWSPGDGGELQLVPFCADKVVIPPLHNRLVIFRSDRLLHRVLPARVPRCCFTVWIDSETPDPSVSPSTTITGDTSDIAAVAARLRNTAGQRGLSRAVYREEYEASLVECQGTGAPCMVEQHRHAVQHACAAPRFDKLVEQLRHLNTATTSSTTLLKAMPDSS